MPAAPPSPPPFDVARPHLVRPVPTDPTGRAGPTRGQARGPGWRRTSWGYYVPASVDGDQPQQRIVEAAHALGDCQSVTGWAALAWRGARWYAGTGPDGAQLPVTLAIVHSGRRAQPGVETTSEFVHPRDRVVVDGLQVVTAVAALAYEMRYAPDLVAAVRAFDMAAADDLVSIAELAAYLPFLARWTGVQQVRDALRLLDENAWSPPEVDARLIWPLELGRPAPLTNRPVFDLTGRHLGTPDLLDVEAGCAVEYDGALHLAGPRRARDQLREDAFRAVGLETLTLLAPDAADRTRMARRVAGALARSPHRPPDQRRWTLEPPPWWSPTHTVELRRALSREQQRRLLRHRRTA